jgi:DNA-binding CsgD family transcriptional regulator
MTATLPTPLTERVGHDARLPTRLPRRVASPRPDVRLEDLSPREAEVLRLVTNCYTNQEISESLYLSLNSVKTYIRGAYRKIGASTRSQAVVWGVRHGLLEPLESADPREHQGAARLLDLDAHR